MPEIAQLVRRAGRRLFLSRLLESLVTTGMTVCCALLVLVLVSKSTPRLAMDVWWPVAVGLAATIAFAVWSAFRGTRDPLAIAIEIDERLRLKDRFAVAWQMQDRDDPFAVAAIADAATIARDPAINARLGRAFRPEAPRAWWMSILLLSGLVGVWSVVPQGNLFAASPQARDVELVRTREAIKSEIESLAAVLDDDTLAGTDLQATLEEMIAENDAESEFEDVSPEEMRRDAIRQMATLQEQLDQLLDGDEARLEERLQESLAELDAQGLEDVDSQELAEALARGDFNSALESFEQMRERLEGEDADSEGNEALARDLEKIAKELERLASDQDALEDALRQAGMDPDLAANEEALKQAMQKAGQLNESQRQAIEKMMQSQSQSSETLKDLAKSMQEASQCNNPSASQGGEKQSCESGAQSLSKLEQMQQMLQQARSAQQQCQNAAQKMGSGLSDWASSLPSNAGSAGQKPGQNPTGGMKGAGTGAGGEAPKAPTPTSTVDQREEVENRGGDIIAREFIEGEVVTGESQARLKQISDRIEKGDEQGVSDSKIPPHLRDVHRHYFGKVKKRIEEATKGGKDPAPAKDGGTASPAKNE